MKDTEKVFKFMVLNIYAVDIVNTLLNQSLNLL